MPIIFRDIEFKSCLSIPILWILKLKFYKTLKLKYLKNYKS